MGCHYSDLALRDIGQQCAHKLPPASAVQAMFLYEMQRETEAEQLFQGHMFELARVQDEAVVNEARLTKVESHMTSLRRQVMSKDIEERLSTCKVRTDVLQLKTKQQDERMDALNKWVTATTSTVKAVDEILHTHAEQVKTMSGTIVAHAAAIADMDAKGKQDQDDVKASIATNSADIITLTTKVDTSDSEIGVLYEERDVLAARLEAAENIIAASNAQIEANNERIAKLEDLVRKLTEQACGSGSSTSSSPQIQRLSV
jgi:chromosome segregation ATPase